MTLSTQRTVLLVQPASIAFGVGCAADCARALLGQGRRSVLIVSSPSVSSHADALAERLRLGGAGSCLLTQIPAEPDVAQFEALRAGVRDRTFDAVVGMGGGSVLDIAKLLAALHASRVPVRDYFGVERLPPGRLPLMCVPTTAGTGSEVSPNAILYDGEDALKKAVISSVLVPDAAFVDPALTVSMPPALTAATGIDALVHCIEGYANRAAHPAVDLYALQGVRLISAHLKRAVDRGDDLEARSAVALGSLYGGLCLGPVNTAAVHALAYPLGSEFRLAHGVSNALLLARVVRFNLPAAPQRYADIARALGVAPGSDDAETAERGAARLAELCRECGIPHGLGACGVPFDALPGLAASAMKVTRLLRNNPRELTRADAELIYRESF